MIRIDQISSHIKGVKSQWFFNIDPEPLVIFWGLYLVSRQISNPPQQPKEKKLLNCLNVIRNHFKKRRYKLLSSTLSLVGAEKILLAAT